MIRLKRAYEAPSKQDGTRILVERLWPRGLTKERAAIDRWLKDIAPIPELRKWYQHDISKWEEFRQRYQAELDEAGEILQELRELSRQGPVTFVYATKDEEHSSAKVLKEYLEGEHR